MNIETANRLYELRKQNGLSQEEVADKLGISRQAVSKWERAEASPDTDNLISLAKLYNISLDELLNAKKSLDFVEENGATEEKEEPITIDKENNTVTLKSVDDEEESEESKEEKYLKLSKEKHKTLKTVVDGIVTFIALISFLLLGFLTPHGFAVYWVLFLFIPLVSTFVDMLICKRMTAFVFPILIVLIYCFLGMRFSNYTYSLFGHEFTGFWHPFWVLFLIIPVYYVIAVAVDSKLKQKYHE